MVYCHDKKQHDEAVNDATEELRTENAALRERVRRLERAGGWMYNLLDGWMGYFLTHSFDMRKITLAMGKWENAILEATDE